MLAESSAKLSQKQRANTTDTSRLADLLDKEPHVLKKLADIATETTDFGTNIDIEGETAHDKAINEAFQMPHTRATSAFQRAMQLGGINVEAIPTKQTATRAVADFANLSHRRIVLRLTRTLTKQITKTSGTTKVPNGRSPEGRKRIEEVIRALTTDATDESSR